MKNSYLIFFFLLVNTQYAFAETISREEGKALISECKHFRQTLLAPLREIEVEKCVSDRGGELDHCRHFYSDYGESHTVSNGALQVGMFWDSSLCEKALSVEKYFQLNPSKKSYKYQQ